MSRSFYFVGRCRGVGPPARGEALPEGRGASLSAKPCSFVVKHHVFGAQGAAGVPDVVLRSPQTLVPSSSSTTSSRLKAPATYRTWCFTPRKTLFFVVKHHVFGSEWASGHCHIQKVMHEPLFFCSMHQLHFSG